MPGKTVTVAIIGDASSFHKTMQGVESQSETTSGKLGGLGKGLGAVATGFVALDVGKAVIGDFNALQDSTAKLGQAMQDAGEKQTPEFADALERAKSAGEHLGFSAAETTDSIAKLRTAGVDTGRAMEAQGAIMDLARAKHIDMATATDAVIKGMQGQGRALKDLNVELPPHIANTKAVDAAKMAEEKATAALTLAQDKYTAAVKAHGPNSAQALSAHQALEKASGTLTDAQKKLADAQSSAGDRTANLGAITDVLTEKVGGQATAASHTLGGEMEVLKTEAEGAAVNGIGALMPAIGELVNVIGFLVDHLNIVGPLIGTVVVSFIAWKIAMGAIGLIQFIANLIAMGGAFIAMAGEEGFAAAMTATFGATLWASMLPIIAIIAAIAAVIAIGYLLITHWDDVKAAVGKLGAAFGIVFDWLKANWPLILAILTGPFGIAVYEIAKHWDAIKGFGVTVFNWLRDNWPKILAILTGPFGIAVYEIVTHWQDILNFFTGLPQKLGDALGGLAGSVGGAFKAAFNGVIDIINGALAGMGDLGFDGHFGIPGFHVRDLFGGTMPAIPTLHGGGLVPGPPGSDVLALLQAGERVIPAGGGGPAFTINVASPADAHEIAREVVWAMKAAAA